MAYRYPCAVSILRYRHPRKSQYIFYVASRISVGVEFFRTRYLLVLIQSALNVHIFHTHRDGDRPFYAIVNIKLIRMRVVILKHKSAILLFYQCLI